MPEHDSDSQDLGLLDELLLFPGWCLKNPIAALLLAAIVATLFFFFDWLRLFMNDTQSLVAWAQSAWNPEANQEHSKLVPYIFIGLIAYHHREIRQAKKQASNKGLIFVGIGLLFYVLAVRCLQPRMALVAVPFLLYGSALYFWGKEVARRVLFPCAFLIFMVPMGAAEQATNNLQFIVTGAVGFLSNIVGIHIQAVGTTLTAADGTFNFEIAEGCSGIRSITAMAMLTAIYVHITQDRLWKKIIVFGCSALFAIIGNIGRIFTVVLVARFFDPDIAGGIYHDWSGYLFFPFALLAMLGVGKLLNVEPDLESFKRPPAGPNEGPKKKAPEKTTYDY